jgi:hypothetical protein
LPQAGTSKPRRSRAAASATHQLACKVIVAGAGVPESLNFRCPWHYRPEWLSDAGGQRLQDDGHLRSGEPVTAVTPHLLD